MAIDFNAINGKFSQMASQFQSPALINAADEIKNEFQAKAESMFGKVGNLEDTYETLTANLSGDALEKALKDMAGEVKGGMQAIGPVASDLVDKAKILEPQIAKATQEVADKVPAMKEAISSSDLTKPNGVAICGSGKGTSSSGGNFGGGGGAAASGYTGAGSQGVVAIFFF